MCESQRVAVASPVLQGVAVAGVCVGLALPIGLAVKVNRSHRLPIRSRAVVRPARELEARKTLEAAPARLALESARPVVVGVVLTETAEVER